MIRPEQYILQPRYIEKGQKFRNYFYDHIFLGASAGVSKVTPRGGRDMEAGIPLSLFIGNYFNRLHGVRLTATYQRYTLDQNLRDIQQAGVDLDYMFNFTSYLNGYNPDRLFSLTGTLGIGVISSHLRGHKERVYKGQVGLHGAFHIGRNAELFAEPFFAIATDQIDHSGGKGNPANHDIQYGVKAGVSVRFGREKEYLAGTTHNGNLFIEASQGLTFFGTRRLDNIGQTMGTGYTLTVGKWFDPLVGARISGQASDYLYSRYMTSATASRPAYEDHYRAALFSGRAEVMLNPLHFSKKARTQYRMFDVNLSMGGELGRMVKYVKDSRNGLKCNYIGFTMAVQGLYNVSHSTALFIEPRVLWAKYVMPYSNIPAEKKFTDRLLYLNAGARFIRPQEAERKHHSYSEFRRDIFVSAQVGGLKQVANLKRVGDQTMNMAAGLQVGYQPFAFAGVKVGVEYMTFNRNTDTDYEVDWNGFTRRYESQWHFTYGLLNTKVQLMVNLSNLYQGYNPDRKLNVYFNFGPAYALYLTQKGHLYEKELVVGDNATPIVKDMKGSGAWALNGGMTVDYRITPRWSVYAEPEMQYFLKDGFIGRGVMVDKKSLLVKFNIGTSFHF
ncbi:MAG: hypothetical protein NC388_06335 [Clostridium sp.]|nr:hypothetical protein [Clostridium sp.]